MLLRTPLAGLLAVAAVIAGCGGDDKKSDSGKPLTDVAPRASKANIAGGNAPIEEFAQKAVNDAVGYWQALFEKNKIAYSKPTATVVTSPTDNGCGGQFDPAAKPFYLCAREANSQITLGGPLLDGLRTSSGDGAVAFLAGFAAALDANDQVSGHQLSKTGKADDAFIQTTACFTGAWIRNLADRNVLEEGDSDEILKIAGAAVSSSNPAIGADLVKKGFSEGVGGCQGASSSTSTDTGAQPAPSPAG